MWRRGPIGGNGMCGVWLVRVRPAQAGATAAPKGCGGAWTQAGYQATDWSVSNWAGNRVVGIDVGVEVRRWLEAAAIGAGIDVVRFFALRRCLTKQPRRVGPFLCDRIPFGQVDPGRSAVTPNRDLSGLDKAFEPL